MNLRKLITAAAILSVCLVYPARASDAVEPATLTITNIRAEAEGPASTAYYYKGDTLRLTNCVLLSGTSTSSAPQGLSDVTIELKVGNALTSTAYSGTAQVESNGTWGCDTTVPTNEGRCYLQVKITDVNSNNYTYSWKEILLKDPL